MAGCHLLRPRGCRFAVAFAVSLLTSAGGARAQYPPSPSPLAGMPAQSFADTVGPTGAMPVPTTAPEPAYYPGGATAANRVVMGPLGTITESICGKPDPNTWRPLTLSTLFSEGWNEAWVPSPNGSSGAPRQGWINAADGNMYRLGFFTFAQAFNNAPRGNAYAGAFTLYTPFSRRLELITFVPFFVRNGAETGLPVIGGPGQSRTTFKSSSGFGDLVFTPRVLLHETKDFSLTADLSVVTPTGNLATSGRAGLTPAIGFWTNLPGRWVIRGGFADAIATAGKGNNTLISQLAIGQTLTDHDVALFGDFTYYLSAVVTTPLDNANQTSVSLTPGIRTHLGRDCYFLAGLPTPLTRQRVGNIGMIFWFMKAW